MLKKIYFPSEDDWKFWFDLEKKLHVISYESNNIFVISPIGLEILRTIYNTPISLAIKYRPPLIDDISNNMNYLFIHLYSHLHQVDSYAPSHDNYQKDKIIKILNQYDKNKTINNNKSDKEINYDYIEIDYVSNWKKKRYPAQPFYHDARHQRKAAYFPTHKGLLAYEIALRIPWVGISYLSYYYHKEKNNYFNLGVMPANRMKYYCTSIIEEPGRWSWSEESIKTEQIAQHPFVTEKDADINSFLKADYDRFWAMTNEACVYYREYGILRYLINNENKMFKFINNLFTKRNLPHHKMEHEIIKEWPYSFLDYHIDLESNMKTILKTEIIDKAKERCGITKKELEKYAPKHDPIIKTIKWDVPYSRRLLNRLIKAT